MQIRYEIPSIPDLVVHRQKSAYKPFTKNTLKLDRCPKQKTITKFIKGKTRKLIVPCGKCAFCLHKRQNELILRCRNELLSSKSTIFVTLTYNNEHLKVSKDGEKIHGRLDYTDIQHFIKRLRSNYSYDKGSVLDFRYLVSGEYGDVFHRPHYHIIFFFKEDINLEYIHGLIKKSWQQGFIFPKRVEYSYDDNGHIVDNLSCTINSIAYCTKYVSKLEEKLKVSTPPFIKWSKGLGKDYVMNNPNIKKQYHDKNRISYTNKDINGELKEYACPIPIYYRNKVLSPAERYILTGDYFLSPQYANQLSVFEDYVLMEHLRNLGKVYEQKSKEKLNARIMKRKQKLSKCL